VGISSSIEHDSVVGESYVLEFVYEFAFVIALKVFDVNVGKSLSQVV
jgi:hypothetical protein